MYIDSEPIGFMSIRFSRVLLVISPLLIQCYLVYWIIC